MTIQEVVQVKGIRCERCMARLAKVLENHDGLESANADFQGNVTLVYDDARTDRDALVTAMQRGGFSEIPA
jgi:copper chaperone CopZ